MSEYRVTLQMFACSLSVNLLETHQREWPRDFALWPSVSVCFCVCVCVLFSLEVCRDFLVPVVIIISVCLHHLTVHSASKAVYAFECECLLECVCMCVSVCLYSSRAWEARCNVPVHWSTVTVLPSPSPPFCAPSSSISLILFNPSKHIHTQTHDTISICWTFSTICAFELFSQLWF